MLLGVEEPESWLMDCSPPAAAWELPPPQGEELGGELGSLEEVGAAFTECERADAALASAEAQMGRGCPEESPEGNTALAGDLLEEENWEWLTALGAAIKPPPQPEGARGRPPARRAPRLIQGPPPAKGDQENPGPAPGRRAWPPRQERPPPKGPPPGGSLAAPAAEAKVG